ncbi:hypothetical protein CEXT_275101 [Caerostris extrusa]|uniref:Uncharacterized protein n=1 Tax=Caerostris extrusa TaxID=172846 RepID=A0AAV4SQG7_CAEEX|nr:hypothetical protein CEXT_275101 [Caerostris extrusa]
MLFKVGHTQNTICLSFTVSINRDWQLAHLSPMYSRDLEIPSSQYQGLCQLLATRQQRRFFRGTGVLQGSLRECKIACAVVTDHAMSSFVAAHACYMDRVLSHDPHTATCLGVDPLEEDVRLYSLEMLIGWNGRDETV